MFWRNFPQNGFFQSRKSKNEHYHQIQNARISLCTRFFEQVCPKRSFLVKNHKNEHHHRVLYIKSNLGTKLQPKQKILIFWNIFFEKGSFWSETAKTNITVELRILKLVDVQNFSLNKQCWSLNKLC